MTSREVVRQVLLDQREENAALVGRCRVERVCEREWRGRMDDRLIKVIMGVRRSGKTVLAHRLLAGRTYGAVNFDDERLFRLKADGLNDVLEILKELSPGMTHILLDEIQNVDGWELFANRLQRSGLGVVITGSNAHLLSRDLATHLTGRHASCEVYPYSFREYLTSAGMEGVDVAQLSTSGRAEVSGCFQKYFECGGFPEINEVSVPRAYLQNLYDKILTRDIAMRHGVRHIRTMKEIAAYVAANCGTKLSYQKTADAYGLGSLHTARNYLSYFEEAYLFFGVEMFSSKIRQKVRAPRKMYGIDPALIRATGGSVDNRGLLLENLVYLELLRRGMGVHYFAEANGASEVDFLCSRGNRKPDQLIQVCLDLSREETREREFRGLVRAAQALGGMADEQLLVLTYGEKGTESAAGRRIRYMPVWEWCLNPS